MEGQWSSTFLSSTAHPVDRSVDIYVEQEKPIWLQSSRVASRWPNHGVSQNCRGVGITGAEIRCRHPQVTPSAVSVHSSYIQSQS